MTAQQFGNALNDHEATLTIAKRLGELVEQQKLANLLTMIKSSSLALEWQEEEAGWDQIRARFRAMLAEQSVGDLASETLQDLAPGAHAFVGAILDTVAAQRLEQARKALIATGYFTADQVGDDIAPRIIELHSALTKAGG